MITRLPDRGCALLLTLISAVMLSCGTPSSQPRVEPANRAPAPSSSPAVHLPSDPDASSGPESSKPTEQSRSEGQMTWEECEARRAQLSASDQVAECMKPCEEGGMLAPPKTLTIRGQSISPYFEQVGARGTYLQLLPAGCWSPHITKKIAWSCEVEREAHTIRAVGRLCLTNTQKGPVATQGSCSVGSVDCPVGDLEPGVYLISAGNIHVCVRFPFDAHNVGVRFEAPAVPSRVRCPGRAR